MENFQAQINKIIELIGLNEPTVDFDLENRKIIIFFNEGEWFKKILPHFVLDLECIIKLIARNNNIGNITIDVNNYRKEREGLIIELAKAAARKALISREKVVLPAMNSYERRLIHLELSTRPDIRTESEGEGIERRVVVRPI